MRNLNLLNDYRDRDAEIHLYGVPGDEACGVFRIALLNGEMAAVIASSDGGWDHVSISMQKRTPTWAEMDAIKRLFFEKDEWVVQYHPAVAQHKNVHPNCLHLWRPLRVDLPKPPLGYV